MKSRPHAFAPKLSPAEAEEVRRLRARGVPLRRLAAQFGIAQSSVSAICHLHAHMPRGVLRLALPDLEFAVLNEIAAEEAVPVEQLASDLLLEALRNRFS